MILIYFSDSLVDQSPILLHYQLFIVIYRGFYQPFTFDLLRKISEFRNIRMRNAFCNSRTLLWIEAEHPGY